MHVCWYTSNTDHVIVGWHIDMLVYDYAYTLVYGYASIRAHMRTSMLL